MSVKGNQIYHILLEDYKIVFTVIPKNANTSVKYSILKSFYDLNINIKSIDQFHSSTLKYFTFIDNKQLSELDDYLKIVIVRNPFDRLVAGWRDKIRGLTRPRFGFNRDYPFNKFINIIYKTPEEDINRHFIPQYRFIMYNNEIQSNHIMNFEYLYNQWTELQELIKIRNNINLCKLDHLNKGKELPMNYRNYYDKDLKKKVEEKFKKDLETFNYKF